MKQRQCKCGGTEFTASQRCYHDITVNGDNIFIKDIEISQADHPYGPYTCTQCSAEYDELSELAEVEVDISEDTDAAEIGAAAGANTVFEPFKITRAPRKALHLEWHYLDRVATDLLTELLGRTVKAEIQREEYYYWKIDFADPISEDEFDILCNLVQASEEEREKNSYESPIYELIQDIGFKLMAKLLPFELESTMADDDGVWFIGDKTQSTLELALPNGMSLKTQTGGDPDYPCIQVTLSQPECSEDIVCFAEFNSSKPKGKEICISAYAHDLDEPTYYASYHDDGTPCGVV